MDTTALSSLVQERLNELFHVDRVRVIFVQDLHQDSNVLVREAVAHQPRGVLQLLAIQRPVAVLVKFAKHATHQSRTVTHRSCRLLMDECTSVSPHPLPVILLAILHVNLG